MLDEMQEQKLRDIERKGFWVAFWGLALAIIIQVIVLRDAALTGIAGEIIILMAISLWTLVQCLRQGLWDRRLQANAKTNLLVSLAAGAVTGVINFIVSYTRYDSVTGSIAVFCISFIGVATLCFAALSLCTSIYKKKLRSLENEGEA